MSKEREKELAEARKNNQEKFEESKTEAIEIIKNAKHTIILNTDEKGMVCGTGFDVRMCFANIVVSLIRDNRFDVDEIKDIVDFASCKCSDSTEEKLDKLIKVLDKLNEFMKDLNENED